LGGREGGREDKGVVMDRDSGEGAKRKEGEG